MSTARARAKLLTQVMLQSGDTQLVCWVNQALKVGQFITLGNDGTQLIWEVVEVYGTKEADQIHTDWHNNV